MQTRAKRAMILIRKAAITSAALLVCIAMPTMAEEPEHICNQDAMLVFDASGSMSGDGWDMVARAQIRCPVY